MRDQSIGTFLDSLAARQAAPGGGGTAALNAAQAAALLATVARDSDGGRYAQHASTIAGMPDNSKKRLAGPEARAGEGLTRAAGRPVRLA